MIKEPSRYKVSMREVLAGAYDILEAIDESDSNAKFSALISSMIYEFNRVLENIDNDLNRSA